jgi:hypothetical protein
VDKFFKTLVSLASSGKKILFMLANGLVFLLANPEFYSHLASWRVVIHTAVRVSKRVAGVRVS